MDERFSNEWVGQTLNRLQRFQWALEYYRACKWVTAVNKLVELVCKATGLLNAVAPILFSNRFGYFAKVAPVRDLSKRQLRQERIAWAQRDELI